MDSHLEAAFKARMTEELLALARFNAARIKAPSPGPTERMARELLNAQPWPKDIAAALTTIANGGSK